MGAAPNPRRANGSARTKLRTRVAARRAPCWICGLPIDYATPAGDPCAYELDELVPVSKGGDPLDPLNVAAAHRCCNQWRGNRSVATVERIRAAARARFGSWRTPMQFIAMAKAAAKAKLRRAPEPESLTPTRSW